MPSNTTGPSTTRGGIGEPPSIEFCGEVLVVDRDPFTIGRIADLSVDDGNRSLHRRFLALTDHGGVWLLANIGRQLGVSVADRDRRIEVFLAPGAATPLTFGDASVRFVAGPTSYELTVRTASPPLSTFRGGGAAPGDPTVDDVEMTPDQLRLVLALAEPALRSGRRVDTVMPSSTEAAQRLGWTITKFNRKLDNVCHKLAVRGVRGVHGEPGRLAANRRARLVDYALAVRLVTPDDLELLDTAGRATD